MSYIINSKRFGGAVADNLDAYPPDLCYGLKYMLTAYTGPVIRGYRLDNGAQQDFTPDEITDGTLTTFGTGTTVYIFILYDQSGNGRNVNPLTIASLPIIINSGVLNLDGANAFLNQNPLIDGGITSTYNLGTGLGSVFVKYRSSDFTGRGTILSGANGNNRFGRMEDRLATAADAGSGTPLYYKNGTLIPSADCKDLFDNFVIGSFNLLSIMDVDFTAWTRFYIGGIRFDSGSRNACDYPYYVIYEGGNNQTANQTEIEAILNNIF